MGIEYLVGVVVSLLVEALKKLSTKIGLYWTLVAVLVLSVLAAGAYDFFVNTGYWNKLLPILLTAGAFHNFIIRRFEQK